MDATLFWDRFDGRWLRGSEFHYPERPQNLPSLKPVENWPKPAARDLRYSKLSARTVTQCSMPCHSRTSLVPATGRSTGRVLRSAASLVAYCFAIVFTPASRSRISAPPPDQLPLLDLTADDYEQEESEGRG